MMVIKLKSIFSDLDPENYKVHFAKKAPDGTEPLDVYKNGIEEWKKWNSYSNGKNWFNKKYVFSLIQFNPEENTWLFGGVWEKVSTDWRRNHPYIIKPVNRFEPFIGRLMIEYEYKKRATRVNMENHFDKMIVKEILEEPYYESFPGYSNVDCSYETIRTIITSKNKNWKTALSVKGIYLITDTKTGKRYVGKASGKNGIWQRWSDYISNGHGYDVELVNLIKKDNNYAEKYFWFTILETFSGEDERVIDSRESYWKDVLMTRDERFGYNRN